MNLGSFVYILATLTDRGSPPFPEEAGSWVKSCWALKLCLTSTELMPALQELLNKTSSSPGKLLRTNCCQFLQMNISSRDSAVPVFLLRNCAGHLSGSLRTIGAVAVGQLGMNFYCYLGRRACGWHHLCSLEFWGGRQDRVGWEAQMVRVRVER